MKGVTWIDPIDLARTISSLGSLALR